MAKIKTTPASSLKKRKALQLYQKRRFADAQAAYQALCQSDPADAEARHMLGLVYACMGRLAEAEQQFEEAVRLQPDAANSHYVLGGARLSLGKLTAAAESFAEAIRLAPTMAEAHLELGNVLLARERLDQAMDSYAEAARLAPANATAHFQLGLAKELAGDVEGAMACFRSAIGRDPKLILGYCKLGAALNTLGRTEEALKQFRAAQRVQPGSISAIAGEAASLAHGGDYERAYALIAPLLERNTNDPTLGLVYLRICGKVGRCDEATEYLENTLRGAHLPPFEKAKCHHELGRVYDKMHRFDEAFEHFQQGNRLRAHLTDYDEANERLNVEQLMATFTAEAMAQMPRSRPTGKQMIFIVGMPRSGTSLTEQILASHPDLYGAGELRLINDIAQMAPTLANAQSRYPVAVRALNQEALDALTKMYLNQIALPTADVTHVTDKMPHNFRHLGLISLLFPDARIVHCIRSPMDTCLSIYSHNFAGFHPYATDLRALGRYYRLYEKLMRHWKQVVELPILEFHYEDTVSDPEHQVRRLLQFCGLEWNDSCLRFHESTRSVGTASYEQVREPLYSSAVGRWRRYERHLDELQNALGESI